MSSWPYNTAAWQRLRKAKLDAQPLCEPCQRRCAIVVANTVDHIVGIAGGGDAFPALEGLMSMCRSCHSTKTNARDNPHAFGKRRGLAFKGCDAAGLPIDPDHSFLGGIPPLRTKANTA